MSIFLIDLLKNRKDTVMGLRINTNLPSIKAQNSLTENTRVQQQSLQRLSSGNRIASAGDDAAGLAIGDNLKAQITGLNQARRNANDGISMVQVAEGSMNEISNVLIRLRELGVQAASDTLGADERGFIDQEAQQLKEEVERIAQSTEFNGSKLLNGETSDELVFHVGANSGEENIIKFDASAANVTLSELGADSISLGERDDAVESLGSVDEAIQRLNSNRSSLGALQNRLQSTSRNLGTAVENFTEARSRVIDTDVAQESSELVKRNILTSANISVLSQANSTPQAALRLL